MIHIGDYVLTKSGKVVEVASRLGDCIVDTDGNFYTLDFIDKVAQGSNRLQNYIYEYEETYVYTTDYTTALQDLAINTSTSFSTTANTFGLYWGDYGDEDE